MLPPRPTKRPLSPVPKVKQGVKIVKSLVSLAPKAEKAAVIAVRKNPVKGAPKAAQGVVIAVKKTPVRVALKVERGAMIATKSKHVDPAPKAKRVKPPGATIVAKGMSTESRSNVRVVTKQKPRAPNAGPVKNPSELIAKMYKQSSAHEAGFFILDRRHLQYHPHRCPFGWDLNPRDSCLLLEA